MLPDGWKRSTVRDACAIKNNLRLPLSTEERTKIPGEYPYFGPTGVLGYIDHYRIDEEFALIGEDGDHFLKFRDRSMTLLFAGKANVNNHAHIIGNSEACTAQWFHYWFMHRDLTAVLSRQGVARYKLTKAGLEELELWLPPKEEQQQIGRLLSVWDEAIAAIERLLINSHEQKQFLSDKLLSGEKRLLKNRDWVQRNLSDLVKESRITGSGGQSARKLTVKLYGRGVTAKREKRIGSDSTQYYQRRGGQFIYSKLDFLNGAFGIIPKDLDGYESTLDLPTFDFSNLVEPRWFLHLISSTRFYRSQLGLANGGRKARRVNPSDLLRVDIDVPELQEQRAIAEAIDTAISEIVNYERQLAALQRQKRALLEALLTGKRRVRRPKFAEVVQA